VIHRAACANDICLVIFWMDAGFHMKGARNLIAQRRPRKI
jgi:hypothetical protein